MLSKEVYFDCESDIFEFTSTQITPGKIILSAVSKPLGSKRSACSIFSCISYGYYLRRIRDLPILGYNIVANLRARKFYCLTDKCAQKVFCEWFSYHFSPHKRSSVRLYNKILKIALLMGGNSGKRLCETLNIETSSSRLIRCIQHEDLLADKASTHIGIDDWVHKKGIRTVQKL